MAAFALSFFAPLPIMLASIGYGLNAGLIATAAGALLVGLFLHPLMAVVYLVSLAMPALGLGVLAAQEPANEQAPRFLRAQGEPGVLLAWIAALSFALSIATVSLAVSNYASIEQGIEAFSQQLAPMLKDALSSQDELPAGLTIDSLTTMVVRATPAVLAVWSVATLCINLWLAARVAQISGLLTRTWPDLPASLRMPKWMALALVATVGFLTREGEIRVVALVALAALGAAFSLQGLAVLHMLARRFQNGRVLLTATYFVNVILAPLPLIVMALIGVVDMFFPLARPAVVLPSPPNETEPS